MSLGTQGETLAREFLEARGLTFLEANVRTLGAEIDLVMEDPARHELVFVEVRTRSSRRFGLPEASFTARKRRALTRAIASYIGRSGWRGQYRLDVVGIELHPGGTPALTHLSAVTLEP